MTEPSDTPQIKYLYLHDPENPQHVLTIGRTILNGDLYVAHALNKVVQADVAHRRDGYKPRWLVLDRFNKKIARQIVDARLALPDKRTKIPVESGQKFIPAILHHLTQVPLMPGGNTTSFPVEALRVVRRVSDARARGVYSKSGPDRTRRGLLDDQLRLSARKDGDSYTVTGVGK